MKYTLTGNGEDVDDGSVIFLIRVVNILHFTFCSSLKKSTDVWSRVYRPVLCASSYSNLGALFLRVCDAVLLNFQNRSKQILFNAFVTF